MSLSLIINHSLVVVNIKELRDLYDKNSNKTDKTYRKGEIIPDGYYPMVVMAVIRNSEGKFLMQKRSVAKGGDWGVTGGHPKSGETPIEGIITEIKEELGLDFSNEKFIEYDSGCDGHDCYKMYYVNKDVDLNNLVIQKEELSEVRWFSMDELNKMVETGELNDNQIACFKKVCQYLQKNNKVHEMKLQPQFYNYILNGTKRIELRLYDEKRQQINIGDTIKFLKEPDLKESFNAEVVGLLRYNTFNDLFDDFDISVFADKSMTKEELLTKLEDFYPIEKQQQYGVIGIKVKLL